MLIIVPGLKSTELLGARFVCQAECANLAEVFEILSLLTLALYRAEETPPEPKFERYLLSCGFTLQKDMWDYDKHLGTSVSGRAENTGNVLKG